jgi:DNA replication protein DnaC
MSENSQANSSTLCVEQNGRFATSPRPACRPRVRPRLSIHDHRGAAQRASGVADSLCHSKLAYRKETVLFASAIDVINTLAAATRAGRLKTELKTYTKPALLILDELGYLPIDQVGADLLFQVISLHYEQGAMILTSNRAFKDWPVIFNHDSPLTSAVLDRLLHHADTIIIEGKSFRMKEQLEG